MIKLHQGVETARLVNGLEVVVVPKPASPGMSVSLWYDVGASDETAAEVGAAHFLEHMMFKGSQRFGAGELDRRTQALGGSNNAFTSHDSTVYWFRLPAERWVELLEIEADRMAGLLLDPAEVAAEREVIVEEIAMYASDPWDALEQAVLAKLWGAHPYGRPILGTAQSLAAIGPAELWAFHRRAYRPNRARLVLAGPVDGEEGLEIAERCFGPLPAGDEQRHAVTTAVGPQQPERVERYTGELARLLLAVPTPASTAADHAPLRVLAGALGAGRASRLHARLVEHEQRCSFVAVQQGEGARGAVFSVSAEVHEGAAPELVEAAVWEELRRVADCPPDGQELERIRRQLRADFVFGHESLHERALAIGGALALGDIELPERILAAGLAVTPADLARVARDVLLAHPAVVGWSLPRIGNDQAIEETP